MSFFSIGHNSANEEGWPEIATILDGIANLGPCPECGVSRRRPIGDLHVRTGAMQVVRWPDIIACGDYPCFVVSLKFVESMRKCGISIEIGGEVIVEEYSPTDIIEQLRPKYFWIDGWRHCVGKVDFEASGFVDVRFCGTCGNRTDNVKATYLRQHADPRPELVIRLSGESTFGLFTTDISPTAFFGTPRVIECAQKSKLTNLATRPIAGGHPIVQ